MRKCVAYVLMLALTIAAMWANPLPVQADVTSDSVLEMKTTATSLNKGETVEVTFYVRNLETSGFAGYLEYDKNVFENLAISQLITPDYSQVENAGTWTASYNPSSNYLEVKEASNAFIALPSVTNGLLLTIKFTVAKSVPSTTIRLNYPQVYKANGSNPYPSGVSVTINNSKVKKIVLGSESVSGNGSIIVPVKLTTNDGFQKLTLSGMFDATKLKFDSIVVAEPVKSQVSFGEYKVTNSGSKVMAEFTATGEFKSTGVLCYLKFQAVNPTGTSTNTNNSNQNNTTQNNLGNTVVIIEAENVTNAEQSAYVVTGTTSTVTITEKDHALGDVDGNGKINLVDALFALQAYNKTKTLTTVEKNAADVNRTGTVDLVDVTLILQYYNGMIKSF